MIKERWLLNLDEKKLTVEVLTDCLTNAGTIKLNGGVIKAWEGSIWSGLPEPFEIAGHPAILTRRSLALNRHDLLIDGEKVSKKR
ncbi:MAG TPA: hypothetical protein ENH12_00500 [Proteobacteria bacterium]|nr:hypothetical protein [Pseudomonadota bacterium]